MANDEHLNILKRGLNAWNTWREDNPVVPPDLSEADLREANLIGANLVQADLRGADLSGSDLRRACLVDALLRDAELYGANLRWAKLDGANLQNAKLRGASLSSARIIEADFRDANLSNVNLNEANLVISGFTNANLSNADLHSADLEGADLSGAFLSDTDLTDSRLVGANFSGATLDGANFSEATIGNTTFGNTDLSTVTGLTEVIHVGPSTIGIDTLFRSDGKIPEVFLRGAGVPEDFITFVPSLVGRAIEFYSCFISFSHHDEEFSRRLHSRMRSENLRVWFAPDDMKGGRKLHEEIFRAIQIHDKLLLILSDNSMNSEWVVTEIRRARKAEIEENRRKLFPIRLIDFEAIQKWECFDADTKKDLAIEVREFYIPDFSNWKDHDSFEAEFGKLLRDLQTHK
jgi:uncharacterized protein YjbI with pentapeptide repeats